MTKRDETFIIYEPWQVESARAHAARGVTIVCFDFLVGRELTKKRVPYIPLRNVVDAETGEEEWWLLAQEVAREWYRLPTMKFFEYNGIRIAEVLEPILVEAYLTRLFYYARIYVALKEMYPDTHFLIPAHIVEDAPTDDCLVSFERQAVVDAARMANVLHTVLGIPVAPEKSQTTLVPWKSLLVRAYNLLMDLLPHRRVKIYASEYWSHIGPVIERMDSVELIFLDEGGELTHIPWQQLLKHRIRTRHPNDVLRLLDRQKALRASKEFVEQWGAAKKEVAEYLASARKELDWSPVLEACEYLMSYAQKVITDIEALRRIMVEEKPDVVLQLASVGGRHHYFFIMTRIAAQLAISSIELQHASAYIDPRVVYSRIETDYLATYGEAPRLWHERIGHAHDRLISVGSPRFDQYLKDRADARQKGKLLLKQLGLDISRQVLFAAAPYPSENLFHFDSYQMTDFFRTFREVQDKVPGLQVLFKCRNNRLVDSARAHMRELGMANCAATGDEDIFALLCASDAVACGRSTIIYQAILAQKPLVLYPWKVYDTYNAQVYAPVAPLAQSPEEAIHALSRIFSDASYRNELLARQKHFLEKHSFDGGASERMVKLIKRLARKQHGHTSD